MIHATYVFGEAALGLPHLRVRYLADSNSWNVNGTPNLSTVRQLLRAPMQLISDDVFAV